MESFMEFLSQGNLLILTLDRVVQTILLLNHKCLHPRQVSVESFFFVSTLPVSSSCGVCTVLCILMNVSIKIILLLIHNAKKDDKQNFKFQFPEMDRIILAPYRYPEPGLNWLFLRQYLKPHYPATVTPSWLAQWCAIHSKQFRTANGQKTDINLPTKPFVY